MIRMTDKKTNDCDVYLEYFTSERGWTDRIHETQQDW